MTKEIVLLGGWSRDRESYTAVRDTAPKGIEIQIISHIDLPLSSLTTTDEINQLIAQYIGNRKIILVGHSLGAGLALEFVVAHPEKVAKLVLIDAEGIPNGINAISLIPQMIINTFQHGKEKAGDNAKKIIKMLLNPRLYLRAGEYAQQMDARNAAVQITCPTLILWGEKDVITPVTEGQVLHALIPKAKFVLLPGMDHDWLVHNGETFWKALRDEGFI